MGTEATVPRAFCGACGGPILTAGPGPCAECWAPRPAWDTRCVRGCGAVVLEAAATCEDCTWAEERAETERVVAAVRAEWAWVLGREARDA